MKREGKGRKMGGEREEKEHKKRKRGKRKKKMRIRRLVFYWHFF